MKKDLYRLAHRSTVVNSGNARQRFVKLIIDVAISPILARLKRLDDRVLRRMIVLGCMTVW